MPGFLGNNLSLFLHANNLSIWLRSTMDSISDSDSEDAGSIPAGATSRKSSGDFQVRLILEFGSASTFVDDILPLPAMLTLFPSNQLPALFFGC